MKWFELFKYYDYIINYHLHKAMSLSVHLVESLQLFFKCSAYHLEEDPYWNRKVGSWGWIGHSKTYFASWKFNQL